MTEKPTYEQLVSKIRILEQERKQFKNTAKALLENEVKYRTVFERSNDAILIIHNRTFVDCNQATIDMLGYYSKGEFLSTHPSELSPPTQPDGKESYSKAQEMMDIAVKQGSHRFEWNHLKANGAEFPVEVLLTTISKEKDNEVIQTIWRDITEQKQTQETLETSERRFQSLMQQSPAVVEIYDLSGLQIDVNKAYEKFWDCPAETSIGKFNILTSRQSVEMGLTDYVKRAYRGETVTVPEYRLKPGNTTAPHRVGRVTWLSTKIYPLLNNTGAVEHIVVTHEDVSERKIAEENLRHSEERFRSLVETTNDWIWEFDKHYRFIYVSAKITDILGYGVDEILGKTPFDLMPEDVRGPMKEVFDSIKNQSLPFTGLESVNLHKDGHSVTLETSAVPFFDENGQLYGYRGVDRDITQRKKIEQDLLLTESIFTNTIEGIAVTDKDANIKRVNRAFCDITGYSEDEVLGQNPRILKSDRHDDEFYTRMWRDLLSKGQWTGEIWNRRKDGSAYPEWLSISSIKNDRDEITNFVSLFHDISEKKMKEEQLEFLAFHDPLTKLPNRKLLYDRAKISLRHARRSGYKMAFLYMDVDNFKNINDSYGHPFGDKFLIKVKERIKSICRESDTFARYGGDEFVIVLNDISDTQEVITFSDRVINLFKDPLIIEKEEIYSSVSIGMAVFPDDGDDVTTLEKNADMALYEAKKAGKWRSSFFNQALKDKMVRNSLLENELRRAVSDMKTFSLHYQPKIDLEVNKIYGVEALLRWNISSLAISPGEFTPIAEETSLIIPIGKWLMQKAMVDLKHIHDMGLGDISLSINLSAKQFNDDNLLKTIRSLLKKTGFESSKLCFEITESIPMKDPDKAVEIIQELNSMDIKISMDDFGTGYSSLSVLKKFPLKEIKIDRSFIKNISNSRNDASISRAIIQMARSMGLDVVAEGVESTDQLEFLSLNGCSLFQGFLFYKPLPYNDLLSTLKEQAGVQ